MFVYTDHQVFITSMSIKVKVRILVSPFGFKCSSLLLLHERKWVYSDMTLVWTLTQFKKCLSLINSLDNLWTYDSATNMCLFYLLKKKFDWKHGSLVVISKFEFKSNNQTHHFSHSTNGVFKVNKLMLKIWEILAIWLSNMKPNTTNVFIYDQNILFLLPNFLLSVFGHFKNQHLSS